MDTGNEKNRQLSLTRQSQILILGQALAFSFNFLVPVVVVRFFDMSQYGIYKQLFLVIMTLTLILPFGIIESLYYFIPRERKYNQHYIMQTVMFLIFAGLLFLILMLFLGDRIFSSLNLSHLYTYSFPLCLYIVFMITSLPFEKLLIIQQQVKLSSLITVISEILKGVCIITATVITRDLTALLYALILFSALRLFVFFWYMIKKQLLFFSFRKIDLNKIKAQMRYAVPFGFAVVVATLRRYLHQYFISFLFMTKDFAVYAVGSFQLPLMNVIYTSVSNVVLIRISEYQKQKKYNEILQIWINSVRKLAMIYFPVTVLFMISSKEFVSAVFTDRYLESVPIFIVTLMQLPFDTFITHSVLKAFAETKFIFKVNLIFFIVTTLFIYIFIQVWGMIGASIGTVLSFGMIRVVEIVKIKKLMGVSFSRLIPWGIFAKVLSICLICSAITTLLKNSSSFSSPLPTLIMELGLFTFLYVAIVYNSNLLMRNEKEDLKKVVSKLTLGVWLRLKRSEG
jgi:O-antigen/teichoic acid export membrane protein